MADIDIKELAWYHPYQASPLNIFCATPTLNILQISREINAKLVWTGREETRHPVRLISPTLIQDVEKRLCPLIIRKRTWSSFDMVVFHRCSPWARLLVSRPLHRSSEMAPCDNQVILDISLEECP